MKKEKVGTKFKNLRFLLGSLALIGVLGTTVSLELSEVSMDTLQAATRSEKVEKSRIASLRVVPSNPHLWGKAATQRFLVLARYTDGLERDVTDQSQLTLSNPSMAKLAPHGKLIALADGEF